jgi:hypothetical protein
MWQFQNPGLHRSLALSDSWALVFSGIASRRRGRKFRMWQFKAAPQRLNFFASQPGVSLLGDRHFIQSPSWLVLSPFHESSGCGNSILYQGQRLK